jgi:ABC-2 type transport system permease protein
MNWKQKYIAYKTISKREIVRLIRIWTQTILPPIITSSLYFAVFGTLVGSRLEGVMSSSTYMEFITPGLIIMAIMMSAYENSVASFFIGKFQRSMEEILVSPTPGYIVIAAYLTGSIVRSLTIGFVVFLVARIFAPISVSNPLLAVFVALLVATIFALGGLINAFMAKNFDDISWVTTFVITPLTFLGGVFYSLEVLPAFWKQVIMLNPIFYMIELFRHAFTQAHSINTVGYILILLAIIIILFSVASRIFERGAGMRQ